MPSSRSPAKSLWSPGSRVAQKLFIKSHIPSWPGFAVTRCLMSGSLLPSGIVEGGVPAQRNKEPEKPAICIFSVRIPGTGGSIMTYHRQCYPRRPNPARHLQPCILRVLDVVARVDLIERKRNDEEAKHSVNIVLHGAPPAFVVLLRIGAH
jgi:hypothetical protein